MFGIKSSGCFILGIIMGFILALALGGVCVLFFNPQFRAKAVGKIERVWGTVKDSVDDSIDAVKKAPGARPVKEESAPKGASSEPDVSAPKKQRTEIELPLKGIKVSW